MTSNRVQKAGETRILIVDNNGGGLDIITEILSNHGYLVRTALNKQQAMALVLDELPDLIILEGKTFDMDGYEVCRYLKSDKRIQKIPVVFVGTIDDIPYKHNAFEAGCADYIVKPFQPAEILTCVETHTGLGRLQSRMDAMAIQHAVELERLKNNLVEAEVKYLNVINNVHEGIFRAIPGGRFLSANPAAAKMYGYNSPQEMMTCIADIDHQIYADQGELKEFREVLEKEGFVEAFDIEAYKKNGEKMWISLTARAVRDNNGTMLYYEGISEDVTVRKLAGEERAGLESQVLQARKMEALGQLAGAIAHNFNNMLTGIKLHAYLGRKNIDAKSTAHKNLKKIEDIVDSSVNLTKQLLGFARDGKYEIKPIDLNEIIEKTVKLFSITNKEISVDKNYQTDLWAIDADQNQMEQIFLNLFLNAQQAMQNGGVLRIITSNLIVDGDSEKNPCVKTGRYVRVSVADTGTGIDEHIKDRIFEPFFTTKERGIGTGLGLSSVYGIVKNHGGNIIVESEAGKGSRFILLFPAPYRKVAGDRAIPAKLLMGDETVLLVEDEKDILNVGMALLEALGYRTYGAERGRDAVEIYLNNKESIALVILDLTMPDMDGEETLEKLKEIDPRVKVILASGYSMNDKIRRMLKKGCKDFIQKPFDIRMLSFMIREILDKP